MLCSTNMTLFPETLNVLSSVSIVVYCHYQSTVHASFFSFFTFHLDINVVMKSDDFTYCHQNRLCTALLLNEQIIIITIIEHLLRRTFLTNHQN